MTEPAFDMRSFLAGLGDPVNAPDAQQEARERAGEAVAGIDWPGLANILPARWWFIVERDGPPDVHGDPSIERAKAHRVVMLIARTRYEHIEKHGACDARLDAAAAAYKPVMAAFDALVAERRKRGVY